MKFIKNLNGEYRLIRYEAKIQYSDTFYQKQNFLKKMYKNHACQNGTQGSTMEFSRILWSLKGVVIVVCMCV